MDRNIHHGDGRIEELNMMRARPMIPCLVFRVACSAVPACAQDLSGPAAAAVSGDVRAVQDLRAAGPPGLEALLAAASARVLEWRQNKVRLEAPAGVALRAAVDGVARQRDAWASGLYWFTDLEAARAEAARTGRHILSLRLLGNLDEEYCCANCRFFRTVLYVNEAVSRVLRECYVLHWKSVRPAPLLTIDMGDGRRIKRTITGNSIHYLLDAEGRVLDALPGIYSPPAFLEALKRADEGTAGQPAGAVRAWHGREADLLCREWLRAAGRAGAFGRAAVESLAKPEEVARTLDGLMAEAFPATIKVLPGQGPFLLPTSSGSEVWTEEVNWSSDDAVHARPGSPVMLRDLFNPGRLFRFKPVPVGEVRSILRFGAEAAVPALPDSGEAAQQKRRIETIREFPYPTEFDPAKAMVERPILQQGLPGPAQEALDPASPWRSGPSLAERMTPQLWARIAQPFEPLVHLDEASRRFMIQKLPEEAVLAGEAAAGGPASGNTAFGRLLARFEAAIARDMVRNEYYYHTQIHQWLEEDREGSGDVEALNRRVYGELFLTPDFDAWLGLVPEDTYTALENDGCACDKEAPPMRQPSRQQ